jgi:hypothetical protein
MYKRPSRPANTLDETRDKIKWKFWVKEGPQLSGGFACTAISNFAGELRGD